VTRLAVAAATLLVLSACDDPTVAGKTTTTTNGGGGVVAATSAGVPVPGARVLAARGWDSTRGIPTGVDTLMADSAGTVRLPDESWAVVQILDREGRRGAVLRGLDLPDGNRRVVPLDDLRDLGGRWPDRATVATARLYLDSSFSSTAVAEDGSFAFAAVPEGRWTLRMQGGSEGPRRMGEVDIAASSLRFTGSGNVLLDGDTTGSPLLVDDFESGTTWPRLHISDPGSSPWYMWWVLATMIQPKSSQADTLLQAIGPDSTRPGRSFHARFASNDPNSWVALGLTGLELDVSARSGLCFGWRSDNQLKIELQRDSVGGVRPTIHATVPSASAWRDTCVPFAAFVPNSDTPDSLKSWSAFGRRVLDLEFQAPSGGTFLDLDDIFLR
jgi:hypothetical protein